MVKKMHSKNWKAPTKTPDGAMLEWSVAEPFDSDAFITIMNVIHGRNSRVPGTVDLEALAKMAVVTDYLMCHEAMELVSRTWIESIGSDLPTLLNRDLVLWLLVTSVFKNPVRYRQLTRTAILESEAEVPTLGLPISSKIIGDIEEKRQWWLNDAFTAMYNAADLLRSGSAFATKHAT
ncbi:unnamed protein product [Parascedosporium putredinis]|uniref:BTB domain-containing protein n=1 Tax=Parascedosporium putredinis TaxID=1442378 RepID=A0A9P1MCI8_9PEZI|nr:unnamed protein product [Parascedosporium putredinis]CAI8001736.1 unnamed protein product [Parascedosporium putredinis]